MAGSVLSADSLDVKDKKVAVIWRHVAEQRLKTGQAKDIGADWLKHNL